MTGGRLQAQPILNARPGATRWQQQCVGPFSDFDELNRTLAEAGAVGFELAGFATFGGGAGYGLMACLKRPTEPIPTGCDPQACASVGGQCVGPRCERNPSPAPAPQTVP
jgi:hypothetical protein